MKDSLIYKKYKKKFSYKSLSYEKNSLKSDYYSFFIIIPIYNEKDYLFDTLDTIKNQSIGLLSQTLTILVINNSNKCSKDIIQNNYKTHQKINRNKYNFEYIVLDYYSRENALHEKNFGVGLARKIGMDFALNYAHNNSLLFCLDADTLISKNYLKIIVQYYQKYNFQVSTVNFKHQESQDPIINKGIRIYEDGLKSMANKIEYCKSPYGYVSMGSTIVCNAISYIAVGGMPKKKATEDFYFLQSLAKYTSIFQIKEILVFPSSRNEERVYLGTGHRMKEYYLNNSFKSLFFPDESYEIIKKIIYFFENQYNQPYESLNKELNKHFSNNICNFLYQHNIKNIWDKINSNAKTKNQFITFFHQWFDGLKIIKMLKYLS
jgi:hypothetical protein